MFKSQLSATWFTSPVQTDACETHVASAETAQNNTAALYSNTHPVMTRSASLPNLPLAPLRSYACLPPGSPVSVWASVKSVPAVPECPWFPGIHPPWCSLRPAASRRVPPPRGGSGSRSGSTWRWAPWWSPSGSWWSPSAAARSPAAAGPWSSGPPPARCSAS